MGDEKTIAFKMSGLKQEIIIFTNIPSEQVKMGMEVILKMENIEKDDKKQKATIQKLLFEEKTGLFKSIIKEQIILNTSGEIGGLYNATNGKNYQGYCAMVKKG